MYTFWQYFFTVLLLVFSVDNDFLGHSPSHFWEYCFLGVLIIFCFGRFRVRIAIPRLLQALRGNTATLLTFILLRILQQQIPSEMQGLQRFLWYCGYPCFLMLGYYTMRMAEAVDYTGVRHSIRRKCFAVLRPLNIFLGIFVVTNDYHQLMFHFNTDGFSYGTTLYSNGIMCWPVKIIIMLQFIVPVVVLIKDAFVFDYARPSVLLPVAIMSYTVTYHVLYTMNVPAVRNTEMVFVTCLSVLAFWYSALATGLIATNYKYMELFYASGLPKSLAAARLRQLIFLKLESVVAELRPKMLSDLQLLQKELVPTVKEKILQKLRLNASFIKKQCLMFLQGEKYSYVPVGDYRAAVEEAVRYAREAGVVTSLNLDVSVEKCVTAAALATHSLTVNALLMAIENSLEEVLINVRGEEQRVEVSVFFDREYQAFVENFYDEFKQNIQYQGGFSFEITLTEDALSLRLVCEVMKL